MGIVIVDLLGCNQYRLVNIYRSFNPSNGMTPMQFFKAQLSIVKRAVLTANNKKINLIQLIDQPTWKRIVNNVEKKSVLDHVYV